MSNVPHDETYESVSCDVCIKEIPSSQSYMQETDEYVLHFCGIECYAQWRNKRELPQETQPG